MNRFPGFGQRIKQRLRACGFWKKGRPDVARFCIEKGYRPQYVYAWLKDRIPGDENLRRLAEDLETSVAWLMLGQEVEGAVATDLQVPRAVAAGAAQAEAPEVGRPRVRFASVRPAATPADADDEADEDRPPQIIDFRRLRRVTGELARLQAELEAIFVAFPDLYLWLDQDGRLLGHRAGTGREIGVPLETQVGRRLWDGLPGEMAEAFRSAVARAVDSDAPATAEYELPATGRAYEARLLPLRVPSPHGSLLAIVRDITDRRRADETLRGREAALLDAFEHTGEAMVLVDRNRRVVASNRAYRDMLGYDQDELGRMSFPDYTHPEDAPASQRLWEELMQGQRDHYTTTKRYVRKDGGVVRGELTVSLVRGVTAQPQFAAAVIRPLPA